MVLGGAPSPARVGVVERPPQLRPAVAQRPHRQHRDPGRGPGLPPRGALAAHPRPHTTSGQHLYFLLDTSRSVGRENLAAGIAEIERLASESSRGKHRITVIGFGRQPRILVNAAKSWNGLDQPVREQLLHETSLPELNAQRRGREAHDRGRAG
jgi:hypothetical protein